jgi:hypothetical protein
MRRNSLLITESERRQIMSLYGLIKENDNNTTECKINGEVIIKNKNPKHTLISTDIKISLLSGTTTLSETSVDQNNIFNMKVDLKSGDYVLQASGTITFKNEMGEEILRDVDDSSKTTFNVNTLNFGKQKDIKISLNLFLGSSRN